jgi:hypothetical protein
VIQHLTPHACVLIDCDGRFIPVCEQDRKSPTSPTSPTTVRIRDKTPKGYYAKDLHDNWARYLSTPTEESATIATTQDGYPFK